MAALNNILSSNLTNVKVSNQSGNKAACPRFPVFVLTFGTAEGIFWVLISILTLIANVASIVTLIRSKRRNSKHNIFLVSLLASNLMHAAVVHPILAYASINGGIQCPASNNGMGIAMQTTMISLMSVIAISVDQYRAFKRTSPSVTNRIIMNAGRVNKTALIVVTAIWGSCTFVGVMISTGAIKRDTYGYFLLILFIATLVLLAMVYGRMKKFSKRNPALPSSVKSARKTTKCLKLMVSIMCCMLLTWLPATLLRILEDRHVYIPNNDIVVASKTFFLSPLLDPINYVFVRYSIGLKRKLNCLKGAG